MRSSWKLIETHLLEFLRDEVEKTGITKVVVGLSGGLDSAIVATLLQKVFGNRVLAVMMPSQYSSKESLEDANRLIEKLKIDSEIHLIDKYLNIFNSQNPKASNIRIGNFSARIRMSILYDISARDNRLVIGTSNKSEILLGYGTIYGDLASAVNPIGDIYKSDLFSFAEYLDIPESIRKKPPSADLYQGQSDEKEMGYSYFEIDRVLKMFVEERLSRDTILEKVENRDLVDMVIDRIYNNQFKRKMPIVAKITDRTFGHDFLYPRDIKR